MKKLNRINLKKIDQSDILKKSELKNILGGYGYSGWKCYYYGGGYLLGASYCSGCGWSDVDRATDKLGASYADCYGIY